MTINNNNNNNNNICDKSENTMTQHMIESLQKDPEIWDLFTRKEEYKPIIRDQYNRFPYYASSCRNIFQPRVSKYLIEHGQHIEYPEGSSFAVCLTHDIDELYTPFLHKAVFAKRNLQNGSLSGFTNSIFQMRSKKIPLWNFDDILSLEDSYGAKSSFFFMVENPGEWDYNYSIDECEQVLGSIIDRGYEVGLHGGHTTYCSLDEIKTKKTRLEKILNKKVIGYRNHFLRFNVPETWQYLLEAGFLYDTTLGYADCVGFRNGMCHPFKPFNLKTKSLIEILEIPLIIMDKTILKQMNLDARNIWEITKYLIDITIQYQGVLTLLWHNNNFTGDERKLYEKILKYCSENNAWITNGEDICFWALKNV